MLGNSLKKILFYVILLQLWNIYKQFFSVSFSIKKRNILYLKTILLKFDSQDPKKVQCLYWIPHALNAQVQQKWISRYKISNLYMWLRQS